MELTLYDTLTREKRTFTPIDPARVRIYVCGPTVYDFAHIGNARPVIVFDVLFRLLRHVYGEKHVTYVRNITDVDDKIIASAQTEAVDPSVITERYERFYLEDMGALGVQPPDIAPHATQEIAAMIAMIAITTSNSISVKAECPDRLAVIASTSGGDRQNIRKPLIECGLVTP